MTGATLGVIVAVAWGLAGCLVARTMARRGASWILVSAAIVFWPLWAPTLTEEEGPLDREIRAHFRALRAALREAALPEPPELAVLEADVRRSDRTLAIVDRLLADGPPSEALDAARTRVIDETRLVLADVAALRTDLGLALLAGTTVRIASRLAGLQARVRTVRQLAELGSPT